MNVSMNSTNTALASISLNGWNLTIIIMIVTCLILFVLSKRIRLFLLGAVFSIAGLIIYKLSRYIGVKTMQNDYVPLTWYSYVAGFVLVSILIGWIVSMTSLGRKFQEYFDDSVREGRKKKTK